MFPAPAKWMLFIFSGPLKKGRTVYMSWDAWKETAILTAAISGPENGWNRPKDSGDIGIGGERVQMYNLSSGEGPLFAHMPMEMENRFRKLGPNPD